MTPRIGWARPFSAADNDHEGEFNSYTLLDDLDISWMVFAEDPEPFDGRPDNMKHASSR